MKRMILLAITALVSRCVLADTWIDPDTGIEWVYTVSGEEASVGDGSGGTAIPTSTAGDVVVPTTLGGYPVTSVSNYAFSGCSELTSVTIPDGVTIISWRAFMGCVGLTRVIMPLTVASICDEAFSGCSGLISVAIPQGVANIGSGVFAGCSGLTSVVIPSTVTSIGDEAFSGCSKLMSVCFDGDEPNVGNNAFVSCGDGCTAYIRNGSSDWRVDIPGTWNGLKIEYCKTDGGPYKETVDCIEWTFYVDGGLASIKGERGQTAILTSVVGDITVPAILGGCPVASIGDYAFSGCSELTSVTILEGVTSIGDSAFSGELDLCEYPKVKNACTSLAGVILPSTLRSIERFAFGGCISLQNIDFPEGVTNLSQEAMFGCSNLSRVTIPSTLVQLDESAFCGCEIAFFDVSGDNASYSCDVAGCLYDKEKKKLVRAASAWIGTSRIAYYLWGNGWDLPETLETIGSYAFRGYAMRYGGTFCTIPASVTNIEDYAFANSEGVHTSVDGDNPIYSSSGRDAILSKDGTTLVNWHYSGDAVSYSIPTTVTNIGKCAFYGARNLKSIAIPDTVLSIDEAAFGECPITSISFPDSVTKLGVYNFIRCDELQELVLPKNVENIDWIAGYCSSLKRVVMLPGSKTKNIWDMSFYQCTNLTEVVLEEGLECISYSTFGQCSALGEITVPETVTCFDGLRDCVALTNIYFRGSVPNESRYGNDMANPDRVGYFRSKYEQEWQAVLDADGKWKGLPMKELAMTNAVKFVVGEHGSLISGDLIQCVMDEEYAVAPELKADDNWVFMGWEPKVEETAINSNTTFTAVWKYGWWKAMEVKPDGTIVTNAAWFGDEIAYQAPEPSVVGDGRTQIVYLGSSITAPIVTNDFSLVVTGDVSFAWDVRATNYWLSVNTASHGTINGALSGWQAAGSVMTMEAVPAEHYHFIGWTGDISDAIVNGSQLIVTMDKPRMIGAMFEIDVGMAVNAPDLDWSTSGSEGWDGRNATTAADGVHAAHAGNIGDNAESVLTLKISGQGVLSFAWRVSCEAKYDALRFVVDGQTVRSITGETSWADESVTLGFGDHVVQWIYKKGRSNKAGEDTAWLDNVVWSALPDPTLADALNTNLVWQVDGDVDWSAVRTEYAHEGGICAIVEGLMDYETAVIETKVTGAGRISFYWGVSCENGYDWLDFIVDGKIMASVTGDEDWSKVSVDIGDGEHTLEWMYWKDEMDDLTQVGANCAMLDSVVWTAAYEIPPELGTKHLSEFYTWLQEHGKISSNATMATALSIGTAKGVSLKTCSLMDDFIAGTDPEDPNSEFTADIEIVDGKLVVTWTPALNGDGIKEGVRTYRTLGADNVLGPYVEVKEGEETKYNFFRVTVEMP